jgi:hypothetical protein
MPKPTVEAWGRAKGNPVKGWYGRNNRVRAIAAK